MMCQTSRRWVLNLSSWILDCGPAPVGALIQGFIALVLIQLLADILGQQQTLTHMLVEPDGNSWPWPWPGFWPGPAPSVAAIEGSKSENGTAISLSNK